MKEILGYEEEKKPEVIQEQITTQKVSDDTNNVDSNVVNVQDTNSIETSVEPIDLNSNEVALDTTNSIDTDITIVDLDIGE